MLRMYQVFRVKYGWMFLRFLKNIGDCFFGLQFSRAQVTSTGNDNGYGAFIGCALCQRRC